METLTPQRGPGRITPVCFETNVCILLSPLTLLFRKLYIYMLSIYRKKILWHMPTRSFKKKVPKLGE